MYTSEPIFLKHSGNALPVISGNYQAKENVSVKREGMRDTLIKMGIGVAFIAMVTTGSSVIERTSGVTQQISHIKSNVKSYNRGTTLYEGISNSLEATIMKNDRRVLLKSKLTTQKVLGHKYKIDNFVAEEHPVNFGEYKNISFDPDNVIKETTKSPHKGAII